jgi:hypothetical protein
MDSQTHKELFRVACVRAFIVSTVAFLSGYAVDLFVNYHTQVETGTLDSMSIGAFCGCAAFLVTMPLAYLKEKNRQTRQTLLMARKKRTL